MNDILTSAYSSPILGTIKNRIVMSAMTRGFAGPDHVATSEIADYYARRAAGGVGLILTEGVVIHPSADGYKTVPRLHTAKQAESWVPVVDRVHLEGSKIFCQLWHCGRISHSDFTDGIQPVSSTDVAAEGINRQNGKPYGTPRRLPADEIPAVHEQFVYSAKLALQAGFDGVELHLGHGYLADQFFDDRINDRDDRYGGSVENRCRFALEATEAVLKVASANEVIVRISPSRDYGGVFDWNELDAMLGHLIPRFDGMGLRMLDVSCARADYFATSGRMIAKIRAHWKHLIMGGASLTKEQAEAEISNGHLDLVTWGRAILANPDFGMRLAKNLPMKAMEPSQLSTLY